jgi:NAD(P)-dependent dehydrogenase (short-subunit alcohol dehydrogenase family)
VAPGAGALRVPYDLTGKVVLVTGAARGIGLATAHAVTRRGARAVLVDLHGHDAERAAAEVGPHAVGLAGDVTDRGAMQQAVATAVERFGGLDVVVANAGIASRGATARAMVPEAFERVLEVDTQGVWRTVQAALPQVVERRGHVVVVASIYAFTNGLGVAPYAMSKAAVEALGRTLRVELPQHGASATTAYFGFIDTPLVQDMIDADPAGDRLKARVPRPLRKRLAPEQAGEGIARAIERRAARVILPRRWTVPFVLRGVLGPALDELMARDARTQAIARELDARAGAEQPLSAS